MEESIWDKEGAREKELTKRLVEKFPQVKPVTTLQEQLDGIDVYIPNDTDDSIDKVDIKFTSKFFLENEQKDGTSWCTDKHDPNIKIWFVGLGCWYLGDLYSIKVKALKYEALGFTKLSTAKTGTTGWFIGGLGPWLRNELYSKRIKSPLDITLEELERRRS